MSKIQAGIQLSANVAAVVERVLAFYSSDGVLEHDDFEDVVADIVTDVCPLLTEPLEAKARAEAYTAKLASLASGGAR